MKRIATILVAATLALGATLAVAPLADAGGFTTQGVGSSGCCKQ